VAYTEPITLAQAQNDAASFRRKKGKLLGRDPDGETTYYADGGGGVTPVRDGAAVHTERSDDSAPGHATGIEVDAGELEGVPVVRIVFTGADEDGQVFLGSSRDVLALIGSLADAAYKHGGYF
jgi:hypothetical protein